MNRNLRRALIGLAIVAVGVVSAGLYVRRDFATAHERYVIQAALGELIARDAGGTAASQSGEIALPLAENSFGKGGPAVPEFVQVVNARLRGRLRYFVFEEGGERRFVVIDEQPAVVASGVVPKDRLTALRE